MDDPQVVANDLQVEMEHSLAGTVRMIAPPLQVQGPSPALGEHSDEILSELGYSAGDIASLRASRVIR